MEVLGFLEGKISYWNYYTPNSHMLETTFVPVYACQATVVQDSSNETDQKSFMLAFSCLRCGLGGVCQTANWNGEFAGNIYLFQVMWYHLGCPVVLLPSSSHR